MATKIQTAGGVITVDSKVEVNEKAISDVIRGLAQGAMRHVVQTIANRIVSRTLPNTPKSGKNPGKKNINSLRRRIATNFSLEEPLRALPNNEGKPIWSEAQGYTALPVVVEMKHRGRPGKGRKLCKPDRIQNAAETLNHILANTELRRYKSAVVRKKKKGSNFVWTTKTYLKQAMKKIQERAGNNIFGWSALADISGAAGVKRAIQNNGRYDTPGGSADFKPSTFRSIDEIRLSAKNNNTPKEAADYQQRVIDSQVPQWVKSAIENELKYAKPHKLVKGLSIPSDVKVTF